MATKKFNILQINLDRTKVAHDLLVETNHRLRIDIAIISEPNCKIAQANSWKMDKEEDAAILVCNRSAQVETIAKGNGYLGLKVDDYTIYSCYVSPNCSLQEYRRYIDELSDNLLLQTGKVLVAGDFNAASPAWGCKRSNERGRYLAEMAAKLDLVLLNQGEEPTFQRGTRTSRPDVTMASQPMAAQVGGWKVLNEETMSDHKYITFSNSQRKAKPYPSPQGWNIRKLDATIFKDEIKKQSVTSPKDLVEATTRVCDITMPRCAKRKRPGVYWWNAEIAEVRSLCLLRCRKHTRLCKRLGDNNEQSERCRVAYKAAKNALNKLILKAKEKCWADICKDVDRDAWGLGYKIVTRELRGNVPASLTLRKQEKVAEMLFPAPSGFARKTKIPREVAAVTVEELGNACNRLNAGKVPGPDRISPEIVKLAGEAIPEAISDVMSEALRSGVFPDDWKKARLVLLRNGGKAEDDPSGYRPLCLLDCYGKLFEAIILHRLDGAITESGGLYEAQYGFRKGRSTIDAIQKVVSLATRARQGTHRTRKFCAVIALDVRNAFNSAPWELILEALERRNIPEYLYNILSSYLNDREIVLSDAAGKTRTVAVTSGVPQGSILGPTLWNIFYDEVLKVHLQEDVSIVGFADDLALVVADRSIENLVSKAERSLRIVNQWMGKNRLRLAPEKTEAILLSGRRKHDPIVFNLDGVKVIPGDRLKYLGVWLDKSLTFKLHKMETARKTEKLVTALGQLMPRKGGPRSSRKKVLASVANSLMLYGAPIWAHAMKVAKYRNVLVGIQRQLGLRISGSNKTVSTEAVQVLPSLIPIEKLVKERARLYEKGNATTATEERRKTLLEWDADWGQKGKGQWTRTLIVDLQRWVNRRHGEMGRHLAQAFSGHGFFGTYLHAIG